MPEPTDPRGTKPGFFESVREDVRATFERDPAATSWLEVMLCYPGLQAVWAHHMNHWLWNHRLHFLARLLSQWVRFWTGVEIHPGATNRRCDGHGYLQPLADGRLRSSVLAAKAAD